MRAEKIILETDQFGRLLHQPHLPPNARMEAIFLIQQDERKNKDQKRRKPSARIMGKGRIIGNILSPLVRISGYGEN